MGILVKETAFHLSCFHHYHHIVIQCHDNPDADAIASGYGLYLYFLEHKKKVSLIYSGNLELSKPNLKLMVDTLAIPLQYTQALSEVPDLLITVDSQVKGGNIQWLEAYNYAEIDHHVSIGHKSFPHLIRPELSACSTLVWSLLLQDGFDPNAHPTLATALYYGLLTDSHFFSEVRHPLDKDMIDALDVDEQLIRRFRSSNLSMEDLETAGIALLRCSTNKTHHFAVLEARPCDPNILGFINDLAIQVDPIHVSIVYFEDPLGIKFSVRSSTSEVKANDFAAYLTKNIGSGGGNTDKAGGYISLAAFNEHHLSPNSETFFHTATKAYFESFDVLYAKTACLATSSMTSFVKKPIVIGYIPSTQLFKAGTPIRIRTLEGDIHIVTSDDTYIMVDIQGEAYPIQREKFYRTYEPTHQNFDIIYSYTPTVRNNLTGKAIELIHCIHPCIPTGTSKIYAYPLKKNTKLFTLWSDESYTTGLIGDYLAIRHDDPQDLSIIRQDIFHKTYAPC